MFFACSAIFAVKIARDQRPETRIQGFSVILRLNVSLSPWIFRK